MFLVSGCSEDGAKKPADPNAPAGQAKPNGPMFAECAGLTPQEVAQKLGGANARVQFRNSVTCQWAIGGTKQASFTWYRGSPIGREESWEGKTRDGVKDISIRNYPGFLIYQATQGQALCELGVDFGNDFIEWSVELGALAPGQDRCEGTRQLAEMSIDRAKK
ncbi:DUF3558 domain-containing protein [Segniliparus rugosus]|uniref:DUF3558 domain-containing protein n=1 Tax=Segniliparus rugosus TaxID=286804 RepID=UPI001FCA7794|nr:DUF3558 domain-containing protein [Segniliparus rugosus]